MTEESVLSLSDHTKTFEVHIEALDFATSGMLVQERHLIAYKSQKLNKTDQHYIFQEMNLIVVVYCLRMWRHYLLNSRFVIMSNNMLQVTSRLKRSSYQSMLIGKASLLNLI